MNKDDINKLFDKLEPSEQKKEEIYSEIMEKRNDERCNSSTIENKKNKIKNIRFRPVIALSLVLILSIIVFAFTDRYRDYSKTNKNIDVANLPVQELMGSCSIDVDDPKELAGDADYLFVARVDEVLDTEYRDMVTLETKAGKKDWGMPYTNYKITVLENIKGKLITHESIPITKAGGVSYDKKAVEVYEDDYLPGVGRIYIMYGYAQKDGSILVSGPNSNQEIEVAVNITNFETTDEQEAVHETDVYKTALDGFVNQVETDRANKIKYKSNYEAR